MRFRGIKEVHSVLLWPLDITDVLSLKPTLSKADFPEEGGCC